MSNTTICAKNIGKRFRIGLKEQEHETLTGLLFSYLASPIRNFKRLRKLSNFGKNEESEDIIWALKDINFEVEEGEVLGIIGKNGAGKSTLLKVLSQITEPTEGRIEIEGRVSSLLEIGTGFHPDLTGRENVYLNGTILGMKKKEIDDKFDEIIAFSGIDDFIDTPVKRYSSGMKIRLGFAVAAHLEPDVLIIDEVLAVGDVQFQKKCLGKMRDVAGSGRTVLFVSHQMPAVKNLCTRCLLLHEGKLVEEGETEYVINEYLKLCQEETGTPLAEREDRRGSGRVQFTNATLANRYGEETASWVNGEDQQLILTLDNKTDTPIENVQVDLGINNDYGERISKLSNDYTGENLPPLQPGLNRLRITIPNLSLTPGRYTFTLFSRCGDEILDWIGHALPVDIEAGDFYGTGKMVTSQDGMMLMKHTYQLEQAEEEHVA